jgi:hypothetical protein
VTGTLDGLFLLAGEASFSKNIGPSGDRVIGRLKTLNDPGRSMAFFVAM